METDRINQTPPLDIDRHMAELARDMERCREIAAASSRRLLELHPPRRLPGLPAGALVGCPGVAGAYSHMACEKLFPQGRFRFYRQFEQVARAVQEGEVPFGVLPVENSSAGQVNQALDLAGRLNIYVCADTSLKVEHCLCVHPQSGEQSVSVVLSHPQALMQCAHYLEQRGLPTESYSNTAAAAKIIGEGGRPDAACICSLRSAALYGLRILERNIQDSDENYTRFIAVSRENILLPGAHSISLALSLPHQPGALNRLLTRFAVFDLDLSRLLSLPIASRDFGVRFHLDFSGSIEDGRVVSLLSAMYDELEDFSFLGNFRSIH